MSFSQTQFHVSKATSRVWSETILSSHGPGRGGFFYWALGLRARAGGTHGAAWRSDPELEIPQVKSSGRA